MIIQLSIIDMHRPPGKMHRGTVLVEISDILCDSHFDVKGMVVAPEYEESLRPYLGKVMGQAGCDEMTAAVLEKRKGAAR